MTGIPVCKASETLISKPSRNDNCKAILALAMMELSTIQLVSLCRVVTLIARGKSHDNNIRGVWRELILFQHIHNLIIDDSGIRIINSTMSNETQLRMFRSRNFIVEQLSCPDVWANDVGKPL